MYEAKLFNEIMELLQIKHTRTTPLHPSGNPVERMNRTLKEHLTLLVNEEQTDWDLRCLLYTSDAADE